MADPVLALQTRIKTLTDITAIVGTRIYRIGSVPTNPTRPYLLLPGTISDPDYGSTNTTDASVARVQVSVFADDDLVPEMISQLLKKKVPCTNAVLPAGTDFLRVTRIVNAGAEPDVNTDAKIYMRHRDFMIYYAY